MTQFRKKPVVIDAIQVTRPMTVETLEGTMNGNPGDWLITGVEGEQYFCKDSIFRATYEPVQKFDGWSQTFTDPAGIAALKRNG